MTANAFALKLAEVEPAAIVTEDGTCNTVLLLERVTTVALTAAELRYTAQASVDGGTSVCVPHASLLSAGTVAWAG